MYNVWGKIKYVDENNNCQGFVRGGWLVPYFLKVDDSSSPSKWSREPYDIDPENEGYYSFDLEDYWMITSEGSYKNGLDRILLPFFWNKNDNKDKSLSSTNITHMAFIDHLIKRDDSAEINLCLVPVKKPEVEYSLPEVNLHTNTEIRMSESSELNRFRITPSGCGPDYETEIEQLNKIYDIEIFKNYKLLEAVYSWGDGFSVTVDKTGNGSTSSTHKYKNPGLYKLKVQVKTGLNSSYDETELDVKVTYNEPNVDFSFESNNKFKGKETVKFTNTTTNAPDNRENLYSYYWTISDTNMSGEDTSVQFNGKQLEYSPEYIFNSPGKKVVTLTCKWNDGFEERNTSVSKEVEILEYNVPALDFYWDSLTEVKGNNEILFHNTTIKDLDDKREFPLQTFDWILFDSNISGEETNKHINNVEIDYTPAYSFNSSGNKEIKLICHWNNGFEDKSTEIVKTLELLEFDISPDFEWDIVCKNRAELVSFTNKTTGDTNQIQGFKWEVEDSYPASSEELYIFKNGEISKFGEGSPDNTREIQNNKEFYTENIKTNFHSEKEKEIKLIVTYFNGWENKTKEVVKNYAPSHLDIVSELMCSNRTPQGRAKNVAFWNKNEHPQEEIYYYDLTINDFYSMCNIDNKTGNTVDNTKKYEKIAADRTIMHSFQNTEENSVFMRTYYDNGWGRTFKDSRIIVHPIVYDAPSIDFDWDDKEITCRHQIVTFSDASTDENSLIRRASWIIKDTFSENNPDNPTYGSISDNTKTFENVLKTFKPSHKFQSTGVHKVTYTVVYDNGFCEKEVSISKNVETKSTVSFEPTFSVYQNNEPVNDSFIPDVQFHCVNTTDYIHLVKTQWILFDRDIKTGNDNEISLENNNIDYKWKYASSVPECIRKAEELMKKITMVVTYDDGWTDNNVSEASKEFSSHVNEVSNIKLNWENLDFNNSEEVYGKERVQFLSEFEELYHFDVSRKWTIENTVYDAESPIISFLSDGEKEIEFTLTFNDGYNNFYELKKTITLEVKKYLEPDLDFEWEGNTFFVGQKILFKSINENTERPYSKIERLKIDYYDDSTFDLFDVDEDGISKEDSIEANISWWHSFETAGNPVRIRLYGYWNNGFEEKIVELVKEIVIEDITPECDLSVKNVAKTTYKFNIVPKIEGQYEYKFEILLKSPILDVEKCKAEEDTESELPVCVRTVGYTDKYYTIYSSEWISDSEKWIGVSIPGVYKVVGYLKNASGESKDEKYFEISPECSEKTIVHCNRHCITGIVKTYEYESSGEQLW